MIGDKEQIGAGLCKRPGFDQPHPLASKQDYGILCLGECISCGA